MKKISHSLIGLVVSVILLIGGSIWLFQKNERTPVLPVQEESVDSQKIRIVAFGDSLTAGYGLPIDQAYPALLEQTLTDRGYAVDVINSGVSGETSAGGVRRAEFILGLDPDIVLFGLGGNDALRFLSPEELEKNLDAALAVLRGDPDAPQVLLLGMRAPGNVSLEYRQKFDTVYPRLAEKYALPLVPFFLEGVALDPRYTQGDGIHPNLAGYQYIVDRHLVPLVEQLLSQPRTESPAKLPVEVSETEESWPAIPQLFDRDFDGRDFTLGRVLERNSAYTRYYITYRSEDLLISGIMNAPNGPGPFPVLILNHGYIDPAIYTNGRGLKREQDYLARQGFAVIHPDYRNHAESSQSEQGELENRLGYVTDVINAVYAIRAADLSYLDTTSIGMLGHSMGGGIAQTVAVAVPDLVKAIVLYAPVSMNYRDSYYHYMADNAERAKRIIERFGLPETNPAFWDGISPETYADRITVPILLFQGTRDDSVPQEWSDKTVTLLKEKGKNLDYVVYPSEGHEFGSQWTNFMLRSADFFRTHLSAGG